MKTAMTKKLVSLFGIGCVALSASNASASSHREAPLISDDPAADNTDVYAWVAPGTHDKLYVVANYNPARRARRAARTSTSSPTRCATRSISTRGTSLNDDREVLHPLQHHAG